MVNNSPDNTPPLQHALYGTITLKELIDRLDNWHEVLNFMHKCLDEGNCDEVKMIIRDFVLSISRVSDTLSYCGIYEDDRDNKENNSGT